MTAPFLCSSDRERGTFARRITLAILIAGACFLAFPLRFAFERPHTTGWLGAVFDSFREMDRPFNQLPSLHIALRTILADTYARHAMGSLRWLLLVWFSLIGFSTVLTYQHHVVDVAGGFLLAALCFYVYREKQPAPAVMPNRRVGMCYLTGTVLVVVIACVLRPWGVLLIWPAASLGIVAFGYFKGGAGIYRKEGGRLPRAAKVMLAPCLLGHQLSLLHYRRQCRAWDEVTAGEVDSPAHAGRRHSKSHQGRPPVAGTTGAPGAARPPTHRTDSHPALRPRAAGAPQGSGWRVWQLVRCLFRTEAEVESVAPAAAVPWRSQRFGPGAAAVSPPTAARRPACRRGTDPRCSQRETR